MTDTFTLNMNFEEPSTFVLLIIKTYYNLYLNLIPYFSK